MTLTIDEHKEAIERARIEGERQGRTEERLRQLYDQGREIQLSLQKIQETLVIQATQLAQTQTNNQQLATEMRETQARVSRLEEQHVTADDLTKLGETLKKEFEGMMNGFMLKLILSGLTGGGVGAGALYGLLRTVGVIP